MKAITFMGMSGVGKTYKARKLSSWGWYFYSCDLAICRAILKPEEIGGMDDTTMLSMFLGKLGNPEQGGLDLQTFKERQQIYYNEEVRSLMRMGDYVAQAKYAGFPKFVHDSTGSFCEIEDEEVIKTVAKETLIVYIKATEQNEKEVIQRSMDYPKPLFFPPSLFDGWLADYLEERGLGDANEIVPDDFSRWVFPKLLTSRLPKYQRIADEYGVTIPMEEFDLVNNDEQFMELIERYEQNR